MKSNDDKIMKQEAIDQMVEDIGGQLYEIYECNDIERIMDLYNEAVTTLHRMTLMKRSLLLDQEKQRSE